MGIRRIAALIVLLAGGISAALPFMKSPVASPPQASEREPVRAALEMPTIAVETTGAERSPATSLAAPVSWYEPSPIVLPEGNEPLPSLPRVPLAAVASDAASHILEPDFTSPVPTPSPPIALPPRRHRIVDGDSLSLLALRYLGDRSRSDEIAQLNRDVIRDVNLLPVGREILIPAN
jgi:nucleoid-associated protein YgaU